MFGVIILKSQSKCFKYYVSVAGSNHLLFFATASTGDNYVNKTSKLFKFLSDYVIIVTVHG